MQQGVQADFVGHESIVRQVAVDSVSQHATLARTGIHMKLLSVGSQFAENIHL